MNCDEAFKKYWEIAKKPYVGCEYYELVEDACYQAWCKAWDESMGETVPATLEVLADTWQGETNACGEIT